MKKFNKGLSYVELILVIAVMAMMVGFASLSIGLINRNNVTKASTRFIQAVNEARSLSLYKGSKEGQLIILNDGGSVYYAVGNPANLSSLNKTRIAYSAVTFKKGDGSELTSGDYVAVKFKQSTGGIESITSKSGDPVTLSPVELTNGRTTVRISIGNMTGKTQIIN